MLVITVHFSNGFHPLFVTDMFIRHSAHWALWQGKQRNADMDEGEERIPL